MLLEGLFLPLTTPFYPDGGLYLRKLEHNVAAYSRSPAAGLALLTGIGEAGLLSESEAREILQTAASAAAPEKVLLAGISRDSTAGTLSLAAAASDSGYDAVLLHAPTFLTHPSGPRDLAERNTFFRVVADHSPLPVLLVSAREGDRSSLPADLIAEMSRHPQVLGLVESNPTPERLASLQGATSAATREVTVTTVFAAVTRRMLAHAEPAATGNYISADSLSGGSAALAVAPPRPALKTRTKRVGFQILAGRTADLLPALSAGATGAMLPFAPCAPQACFEVYAAWKDGDLDLAAEKQARIDPAARHIEEEIGIAAIKAACDRNGYFGGRPRLPHLPASGPEADQIEDLMHSVRS